MSGTRRQAHVARYGRRISTGLSGTFARSVNYGAVRSGSPANTGRPVDVSVAARRTTALDLGGDHSEELAGQSHDIALGVTAGAKLAVDRLGEDRERLGVARAGLRIERKCHAAAPTYKHHAMDMPRDSSADPRQIQPVPTLLPRRFVLRRDRFGANDRTQLAAAYPAPECGS